MNKWLEWLWLLGLTYAGLMSSLAFLFSMFDFANYSIYVLVEWGVYILILWLCYKGIKHSWKKIKINQSTP